MTLLLEIAYYGLPTLAVLAFGTLFFLGKRKTSRPLQIMAVVAVPVLLTAGLLDARWMSDRSALLLNHFESPQSAQQIVDWFGQPDKIVTYPEGDFSWIYSVETPPFRAEVVYAIYHNRIVGRRAGETATVLDISKLRPVPAQVRRDMADKDPVTWVILPIALAGSKEDDWLPTDCKYGRWSPQKKDIPALIEATFQYLWLYKEPKSDNPLGISPDEKSMRDWTKRAINEVLVNRPIYACQIVGYEKDGRKMIHLNFFPKDMDGVIDRKPGTTEPYWHFNYVVVFDGGANFWQIEYDCLSKTFLEFRANGMG